MSKKPTCIEYLYFPTDDVDRALSAMFGYMAKTVQEESEGTLDDHVKTMKKLASSGMSEKQILLPVPLTDEMIAALEKLEEDMLKHDDCERCREVSEKRGLENTCHGILKKGDLLKCLMGGILSSGMRAALVRIVRELRTPAGHTPVSEISAAELFNPMLREE